MGEIRHTFSGGKMNKDLDERIVPQGEYRDASNIEIRTSGDSDVGALQNLYGNKGRLGTGGVNRIVNPTVNWLEVPSVHVGSITDERTNKAYFFVASAPADGEANFTNSRSIDATSITSTKLYKDMIIEYDNVNRTVEPTTIDVWRLETTKAIIGTVTDSNGTTDGSSTVPFHYIDITCNVDEVRKNIRAEMQIQFYNTDTQELLSKYDPNSTVADNGLGRGLKVLRVENLDNFSTRIHFDRHVVGRTNTAVAFLVYAERDVNVDREETGRALNFSVYNNYSYVNKQEHPYKSPITGINIIPGGDAGDLLFWTDNNSEPRKINIKRSQRGTSSFNIHTNLMINDPDHLTPTLVNLAKVDQYSEDGLIQDHITVIKRAPRTSPKLEMSEYENGIYEGQTSHLIAWSPSLISPWNDALYLNNFVTNFSPNGIVMEPGDQVEIATGSTFEFNPGQRFEIFNNSLSIVVKVIVKNPQEVGNLYLVEIEMISPDLPADHTDWEVRTYEANKKDPYFKLKFGRFSFRYKYQDGEYSSFAPWSELAFIPGKFDFIPKKGHNLGMTNRLRMLKVTDFIVDDALRPDDVLEVDVLYKDTVSPNVYIVKTIKRSKNHEWNESGDGSYSGVLDITSEMIHRTLESSQALRAWDNVPRKALAQEVTGNRIVYGNYLQNYDVNKPVFVNQNFIPYPHPGEYGGGRRLKQRKGIEYTRDISTGDPAMTLQPVKSLKSIRRYRIGVVFGDKYGRETPVIGLGGKLEPGTQDINTLFPDSVNVGKEFSAHINKLKAQLEWNGEKPNNWMEYYKFYVKETSNEYYNLVQDRWYHAEDGNLWLSFQSSDRNKVDKDTYLILKNEHGSERPVLEKARYKILAIKNEAPDFIKTTKKILGSAPIMSDSNLEDSMIVNFPDGVYAGAFENVEFKGIGWGRLRGIEDGTARFSEWKKIARMNDSDETVTLIEPFGESAAFAQALGVTSYADIDTYEFEAMDGVVENRPEFDGKFFVKIYKDGVLASKVIEESDDELNYAVVDQLQFTYVRNDCRNDRPGVSNTYRGDFSTVASPVPGSAADQGGVDFTNASWSHNQGLNSNCSGTGSCGAMGNCGSRSETQTFWNWFDSADNNNPGGDIPFLDDARGAGNSGGGDSLTVNHPGLHQDSSHPNGSDGANAMQWAGIGWNYWTVNDNRVAWRNKMTEEGKLFRFAADPTKTVYVISGSAGGNPSVGHNYHSDCNGNTLEDDCDSGSGVRCRQMFKTYFHKKGDPSKGMQWGDWDPRSALLHDGTGRAFIEFVEQFYDKGKSIDITSGNGIWETEPKEDVGMDLYYEATDAIPTYLKNENIQSYIPLGSKVTAIRNGSMIPGINLVVNTAVRDVISLTNKAGDVGEFGLQPGDTLQFLHADGTVTQTDIIAHWHELNTWTDSDYRPASWDRAPKETGYYRLNYNLWNRPITLSWFNCYSFGNGIESDRIRDDFNAPQIDNGCKVSTTLDSFGEERRVSGMIWSGIFNSTSGVNSLNEFNMANPITKDLNPSYGSIQALKTRDTNVVAFCEDKVFKILANKDALYNADGSSNVTASNAVLGDATAFTGDYGISSNPESLAVDSYRIYFTDKQRNKVLRLSQNGLTPISDVGMISWFRDNLSSSHHLIGSFDEIKGEYNLTLSRYIGSNYSDTTVSWSEQTKGWVSFKSFIQEVGLSINDEYLTGKIIYDSDNTNNVNNKAIWSHHNEDVNTDGSLEVDANSFYGYASAPSTVDVLFNKSPEVVKGFTSMNYEGSQARVNGWIEEELLDVNSNNINPNGGFTYNGYYSDLNSKDGWYVSSFTTDLQEASVPEFKGKENKWFEYIKGDATTLSNLDTKEFTVQGVSLIDIVSKPIVETYTLTIKEVDEVP
tara:strand:+ start:2547 stop:8162 length:5616 start_codon:yes stop_codon:yes gene_type:complete